MRKFDLLCINALPEYDREKIRALREGYKLSQAVLASMLNTSVLAVRQRER